MAEASSLPHDVLLHILSHPSLLPRNQAQARLVSKSWARAADDLITFVKLGRVPLPVTSPRSHHMDHDGGQKGLSEGSRGDARAASTLGRGRSSLASLLLFDRLARLPSLSSIWLGPSVVRSLLVQPGGDSGKDGDCRAGLGRSLISWASAPRTMALTSSSSSPFASPHPFHRLSESTSLTSLRLQPDAHDTFAIPQVWYRSHMFVHCAKWYG